MTLCSKINRSKKKSKKLLIFIVMLMSIFSFFGCIYNVDAAWASTKMVNTGMSGWFDTNGIYHSVSDEFHSTVSNKMSINLGNYYATCVLTHARDDGSELELYNSDDSMRQYIDEDGETKYYQWFTKKYYFDFMIYTQANPNEVMPLKKSEPETVKWLDYYYSNKVKPKAISKIKRDKDGYQNAFVDYSGYIFEGNPTELAADNRAKIDMEIAVALGDSFTFPGEVRPNGEENGYYTYDGTSYFIQDIKTLIEGEEHSSTENGLISKEIHENPSIQSTGDGSEQPNYTEYTKDEKDGPNNPIDIPNIPISSVGKAKLVSVNPEITCTPKELYTSGGRLQTLPTHSENMNLETADDIQISKNFQPDSAILPNPLTECYFRLPIDMTPVINYETVNAQYKSYDMVVRRHFCGLGKRSDFVDEFNRYTHVSEQDFVVSREVLNVYYIQSFELTLCVASIYDWIPETQTSDPPSAPVEEIFLENYEDLDISGELQYDSYHPDTDLLDTIFGWGSEDFFRIATVVCIAIALVLLILFLRSFNKAKILKDDTRLLKEASMRSQQYLGMPGFSQYMPQAAPMMQMTPSKPMNNGYQMQQPINQGFNAQVPPSIQSPYDQQPQKVNSNATDTEKVIKSKNPNQTLPESSVVLAVESKASTRNTLTALTIGISIGIIVFLTLFNFLK